MNSLIELIDTHTHLTMDDFQGRQDEILDQAQQVGVTRCINIGTTLEDNIEGIALADQFDNIYCTVGIHPHEAANTPKGYIAELKELTNNTRVKAIGEIGLDFYYDFSDRPTQKEVFAAQVELARQIEQPIVIHCRDAHAECLAILKEQNVYDYPVVFHCFGEDRKTAKLIMDSGFYVSFTGIITFKKSDMVRDTAQYLPLDRIMIETDCPYMSPEPLRKIRPNTPALLVHIADKLAEIKELALIDLAKSLKMTSESFFRLE